MLIKMATFLYLLFAD